MSDNLNDQDFYKEFKDRMNMDPLRDEIENKKSAGHTLTVVLAVITGIVISSLIGWYVIGNMMVSRTGTVNSLSDIPTIRRVSSQVKIKPADEGGMKIANQEKKVYDLIGKTAPAKETKEKVVSDKTTVVAPAEEEYIDSDPAYGVGTGADDETGAVVATAVSAAVAEKSVPDAKTEKAEVKTPAETKPAVKQPTNILPKNQPTEKKVETVKTAVVEKKAATDEKKDEKAAANVSKPAAATAKAVSSEVFKVQVTSAKDEKQVKTVLNNLLKKFPETKNMPSEIQKADLGKKGVYYRLKIGAFKTREEASALCAKFKPKVRIA